jgi:hypothetical protein
MDKKMVCPCGLTCCDCMFYKSEIYEAASRFKDTIKKYEFDKFLSILSNRKGWETMRKHLQLEESQMWDRFGKHFDAFKDIIKFMSTLDSIIGLQCKNTCQEASGCSFTGETHKCGALECIIEKEYKGCWECSEYRGCDKLSFLRNSYGKVIEENLNLIKEKGIDAVESRGNEYYAWQRK